MKKFKTTIEIITEADNGGEASEIAGEYLSGNISSGVRMKCRTKAFLPYGKFAAVAMAFLLISAVGVFSVFHVRSNQNFVQNISGITAIQPPLKSSMLNEKDSKFRKEWQDKHTKKALEYIKK